MATKTRIVSMTQTGGEPCLDKARAIVAEQEGLDQESLHAEWWAASPAHEPGKRVVHLKVTWSVEE